MLNDILSKKVVIDPTQIVKSESAEENKGKD